MSIETNETTTNAVRFVIEGWAGDRLTAHEAIAEEFGFEAGESMTFASDDDAENYLSRLCETLAVVENDEDWLENGRGEFYTYMVDAEGELLDDEEAEIAYEMYGRGESLEAIAVAIAPLAEGREEREERRQAAAIAAGNLRRATVEAA